jgi:YidC/Oxa1 family membrane protein insertase
LPETHNPDLQSRNAGHGDLRHLLVFSLLAIAVLLGYQYLNKLVVPAEDSRPANSNQAQSAALRIVAPPAVSAFAAASDTGANDRSLKSKVQFGWLTFIAKPLYFTLRFIYEHGIRNWGWAIIFLTVIFNLLLLWPRMMSMKSSLKMMRVQPAVDALKKRYVHLKINDPKRTEMHAEMMALYKAEGATMYGGCLSMVLQMPLLFGYLRVLRNATELQHANWLWLTDLSKPDPLHILPILIIGTMFLTQYITPAPGMDPFQRRMLAILMPLIMGFSLWRYASGLALYWATGNLVNLTFQFLINRSKIGKEMRSITAKRGV